MKVLPYDVRAVSGVNQNLVVSVSLPLHLLGAVGSWRLRFAVDKEKGGKKDDNCPKQKEKRFFNGKNGYLSEMGGVTSLS